MTDIRLQLPNGKTMPATLGAARFGHTAVLSISTERPEIRLTLRAPHKELAAELYRLYQAAAGATVTENERRVLEITPEEVVLYFEASPVLREMAGDVRQVLLGKDAARPSSGPVMSQLDQDLTEVRRAGLQGPSKADISELLTGERFYSGAIYRRVSAVFEALNTSSSTPATGEKRRIAA